MVVIVYDSVLREMFIIVKSEHGEEELLSKTTIFKRLPADKTYRIAALLFDSEIKLRRIDADSLERYDKMCDEASPTMKALRQAKQKKSGDLEYYYNNGLTKEAGEGVLSSRRADLKLLQAREAIDSKAEFESRQKEEAKVGSPNSRSRRGSQAVATSQVGSAVGSSRRGSQASATNQVGSAVGNSRRGSQVSTHSQVVSPVGRSRRGSQASAKSQGER